MRLPSWIWLLLCAISFAGSVLAWSLERHGNRRQAYPAADLITSIEPIETSPNLPDPLVAQPMQSEASPVPDLTAQAPTQTTFTAAPRTDTSDNGAKVLRCVVHGRVTYVDVASGCADGSAGKVTLLPR